MKMKEFRELTANVPDDANLSFMDPNFGGEWDPLERYDLLIQEGKTGLVLIQPPAWEPVD